MKVMPQSISEDNLMEWYDGSPVTERRIAELRYMLVRCRGILHSLTLSDDPQDHPTKEEIKTVIKETDDLQ